MTRHALHPPSDRHDRARGKLRTRIAHLAAKLIAEGLTDYNAAKSKAARQLNCDDRNALPDNYEIEVALRGHLALFAADTQPEALHALRRVALRAMRWLQTEGKLGGQHLRQSQNKREHEAATPVMEPWLTGAVLNGTANEFSEIELELIGLESKAVEFMLLNRGIEFELRESGERLKNHSQYVTAKTIQYHLEFEDAPLVITLYESQAQRLARHPPNTPRHERVQLAQAAARFVPKSERQ